MDFEQTHTDQAARKWMSQLEEAYSLEAGFEVKYLIMLLCIEGIRQQHKTAVFTAIIPAIIRYY